MPLAGAVAALVVLGGAAAAMADGAQNAHRARVALTRSNPVTVHGAGFTPSARVRITLSTDRKLVRRPITNRLGRFTTTFPAVIDRCSAWTISASQPGRATVVLRSAKPACAPASTP